MKHFDYFVHFKGKVKDMWYESVIRHTNASKINTASRKSPTLFTFLRIFHLCVHTVKLWWRVFIYKRWRIFTPSKSSIILLLKQKDDTDVGRPSASARPSGDDGQRPPRRPFRRIQRGGGRWGTRDLPQRHGDCRTLCPEHDLWRENSGRYGRLHDTAASRWPPFAPFRR